MSSFHDSAEDLESSIANLPAEKLNLIFQILKKQGTPGIIDDLKKFPAIKFSEFVVHDFQGPDPRQTTIWNEYLYNVHFRSYTRRGPASPTPSPLVETITNSSGITFTTGISGALSKKIGGSAKFGGSSHITLDDDSILNVTDEIGIAGWLYLPAGISSGDIIKKNNQYQLYVSAANVLSWRVYSGGAWKTPVDIAFTNDVWTHIAATYKSAGSGQKIYKNSVLTDSDSETGAIATSANDLGLGHDGAGSAIIPNNTRIAWLSALHKELTQSWINAHLAGLLDTNEAPEIFTYPFTVWPNYESDMHPGNFKPS